MGRTMQTARSKLHWARLDKLYQNLSKAWKKGGLPAVRQHLTAGPHNYAPQLLAAAGDGRAELVKELLAIDDGAGWAALMAAIESEDSKAVQQLIDAGADVSSADKDGRTPLHEVAASNIGMAAAVEALIAAGAGVSAADHEGCAPLHDAAHFPPDLLQHGAVAYAENIIGRAPLLFAAELGQRRIVTSILADSSSALQSNHIAAARLVASCAGHADTAAVLAACSAQGGEQATVGAAAGDPSAQGSPI